MRRKIADRELGINEFARSGGVSGPLVSQIMGGIRTPPLDRMQEWADILGLPPGSPERSHFLESALLAHAPPEVRSIVARLREGAPVATAFFDQHAPGLVEYSARITALEATITELRDRLAAIAALAAPETPAPQPAAPHRGPTLQLPARVKK